MADLHAEDNEVYQKEFGNHRSFKYEKKIEGVGFFFPDVGV